MLQGIFRVTFQSSLATMGEGIAVFDACGVHGANENHAFRGRQVDEATATRLLVEILHLHGEKYPSFGPLSAINLDLVVTAITPEGFKATGTILEAHGIRLKVVGVKLAELLEEEG